MESCATQLARSSVLVVIMGVVLGRGGLTVEVQQ